MGVMSIERVKLILEVQKDGAWRSERVVDECVAEDVWRRYAGSARIVDHNGNVVFPREEPVLSQADEGA
jgi:hypothetical protein